MAGPMRGAVTRPVALLNLFYRAMSRSCPVLAKNATSGYPYPSWVSRKSMPIRSALSRPTPPYEMEATHSSQVSKTKVIKRALT